MFLCLPNKNGDDKQLTLQNTEVEAHIRGVRANTAKRSTYCKPCIDNPGPQNDSLKVLYSRGKPSSFAQRNGYNLSIISKYMHEQDSAMSFAFLVDYPYPYM